MTIRSSARKLVQLFGFDIVRYATVPENTLLGIRNHPIKTILDIGANRGQSTKKYLKLFEDATVYCFEPLPEIYLELDSWAKIQNDKVKTFNVALGQSTGRTSMKRHVEFAPSSSLLRTTKTSHRLYP